MDNGYFKLTRAAVIIFIMIMFSCSTDKTVYFEEILKSNKKHFRGAEIGTSVEKVKSIENSDFLLDDMDDYLHYDYELETGNSYTVTYSFYNNSLYAIELATYLEEIKIAELLFEDFYHFFDSKYEKGKLMEDGYHTWYSLHPSQGKLEFALKEDSKSYGYVSIKIQNLSH